MTYNIPKVTIEETQAIRRNCIERIIDAIQNLENDRAYTVKITQNKDRRTLDQNSKFHVMCQELGDTLGYTCEEVKKLVKNELGFYEIIDGNLGKVKRLDSSADWDTEKMSRAIEQLNIWAIDCGHRWRVEV